MKYGLNAKLVEEVIEFVTTMQESPKVKAPENLTVVNSIDEAKKTSLVEVFGEDEFTWSDIRQLEMGKVKGKLYRLDQSQKPEGLEDLTERISNELGEHIPDWLSDFFENVVVDLRNCAVNRAINGTENNFYDQIYKIYQSGGFPCGWNGNYPEEGNIMAFYGKK
ncbi:hypothetical protein [Paenibacillus turpanensis]|uniref:hypothetical protein n=1 Tax=Paenibacillus turpanensis TaxID=2689078 RepID=UPI001407C8B4|nr:hypothetical protein [Paenibacillus turpanensis]